MSVAGIASAAATGQELLRLAREHIGERYVLGILAPKDNPSWKGPWDCAEFASWLVFQVARKLYGCEHDDEDPATADAYTGYWARDAKSLGQIVSIEQAASTPGAAVLRIPQANAIGHIVISDGVGGTVEAHSTATGVVASTLSGRRWDKGILTPGIQYSAQGGVVINLPTTMIYRLTTPPMSGDAVRMIQEKLRMAGFDPGEIDGDFGPHTQAAVLAFQLSHGLVADGEVGPQTEQALGIQV